MYGLPQAGILAYNRLVAHLALSGYTPVQHTPGLFRHATRPVTFSLVVDDFAIKYVDRANAEHLLATLRSLYNITTDWTASMYCGITLKWDYVARTVNLSMPGYNEKALNTYLTERPKRPQHAPHAWTAPSYGSKVQLTAPADNSKPLDAGGLTRIQQIIGTLLFYGRAIDSILLVALGTLLAAQSKQTAATAQAITQLLNYCATHPEATIRFIASEMHLHIHSNASYLSVIRARSRAGGYFFLSDKPKKLPPEPHNTPPPLNGAIHVHSSIMRSVLSSATEAETGALFHKAKDAAPFRITLLELGHPQGPTPVQTDNACASGIINDTVKQRRSKAMDMRFYWIKDRVAQDRQCVCITINDTVKQRRSKAMDMYFYWFKDRVAQDQYVVHWRIGSNNLADYFTKHHSPSHHCHMRSRYLVDLHRPASLQGCVEPAA